MKRRLPSLTFAFVLLAAWFLSSRLASPVDVSDALTWYDTLGFPDAKDLPYVRVATGSWIQRSNQPPERIFVEGFLVGEEPEAFAVFLCSVSDFKDAFGSSDHYPPLNTVRFVRKSDGPAYKHVAFEILDFKKVASDVLERVRRQAAQEDPGLRWGRPLDHRACIFGFARACRQKGLSGPASELMDIAANIPDEQTGKVEPQKLRDILQAQIGHAVLIKAEEDVGNPAISLPELLKAYQHFDTRYPASPKAAYAREAADLLRKMIAEEAAHHPKPLEQMSPAEQVAENIYQLRNLGRAFWVMNERYPLMADSRDGKEVITPVHRLVDLGHAAVPQLIEALDDRRFTRSMEQRFNGLEEPVVMRVGDVAQHVLEHLSGRNFYQQRTDSGKLVGGTTRQLAEAWWAGVQGKGEKQMLIDATSAGGQGGCVAARKLVEKYPDAALEAIKAGIRATPQDGIRSEYVEVAGTLPGGAAAAFLKSQLDPGKGLYSQVHAAGALFRQGQPGAVPAMIEAWQKIQPRLPTDEGDAYSEVGGLITFLATSGDVTAIEALGKDIRKTPVDVRLAVVKVFLPFPKNGGGGGIGKSIHVPNNPNDYMATLPGGEAGAAIERLLASALNDTERRVGMEEDFNEFSYADPRVCDMAALVLAQRWPKKYQFQWVGTSTDCDAQIARLRNQWRAENGLPPLPPPTPVVGPTAAEAEPAGRVREVQVVGDAAGGAAKFDSASLKGQFLNGKRLDEIAQALESASPPGVRGFTFIAERAGDGTGFKVEIAWIAGEPKKKGGWSRDLTVRTGHKNVYNTSGWASENGVAKGTSYRDMAGAFEQVLQSETDAPIFARFRVQRGSNP